MPENSVIKQLNLSDLIHNPSSVIEDFNEIPDNTETEYIKEYGIGIDCHSKFIEVCVRYRCGKLIHKAQSTFTTEWDNLVAARDWCLTVLKTKSDPVPDLSEPIHYLVESTANYHMPVCMAFGGNPTIINPTIAGATKRKTDVLDSRLLALHDQLNIWREFYMPDENVKILRVLIAQRERCIHDATIAGNRINNIITRFGLTVGRDGSVVKTPAIRAIVEDQISDNPSIIEGLCPIPIPLDVRIVLREEYSKYDFFTQQAEECKSKIFEKACSMEWETATGTLPGNEMIRILSTAPQIGELTAIIWLARIVTPRREYSVLKRPLIRNRIPTNRMSILSLLPRYRLAYRPPCSTTSQSEISLKPILVVDHSGWFYPVSFRGLKVSLTRTNGTNDAAPWSFQSGIFTDVFEMPRHCQLTAALIQASRSAPEKSLLQLCVTEIKLFIRR